LIILLWHISNNTPRRSSSAEAITVPTVRNRKSLSCLPQQNKYPRKTSYSTLHQHQRTRWCPNRFLSTRRLLNCKINRNKKSIVSTFAGRIEQTHHVHQDFLQYQLAPRFYVDRDPRVPQSPSQSTSVLYFTFAKDRCIHKSWSHGTSHQDSTDSFTSKPILSEGTLRLVSLLFKFLFFKHL
jgi:hypothetical protein